MSAILIPEYMENNINYQPKLVWLNPVDDYVTPTRRYNMGILKCSNILKRRT